MVCGGHSINSINSINSTNNYKKLIILAKGNNTPTVFPMTSHEIIGNTTATCANVAGLGLEHTGVEHTVDFTSFLPLSTAGDTSVPGNNNDKVGSLSTTTVTETEVKVRRVGDSKLTCLHRDLEKSHVFHKELHRRRTVLVGKLFNDVVGAFVLCACKLGEMDEKVHVSHRALLKDMNTNNKGAKTKRRILARKQAQYEKTRSRFILDTLKSHEPPEDVVKKCHSA